jgi:hypothetical protein
MNLKVDAGAMILGCVALRPMEGEKGAGCFVSGMVGFKMGD